MNLPNLLTLLRIILIPVLVAVFYLASPPWNHILTSLIFALAAITDWLDGWLARRMGQSTPLGAFLDPVADKLIVATVIILLVQRHPEIGVTLAAMIIIGREILISALREWMAQIGERGQVAVAWTGKAKTATQMVALLLMLWELPLLGLPILEMGKIVLYLAAGLTLWSMIEYLRAAMPWLLANTK